MYSPRSVLPRAYFAHSVKKASWQQFYALMLDHDSSIVPSETFVEDDMPTVLADSDSRIRFVTDTAEAVVLNTQSSSAGLLVLCDQFYPGWTALVDGSPAKIYRINFFARGLLVPAGSHSISFEYKPQSVAVGLMCAIGAAFLLCALLAWSLFRRQSPNSAAKPPSDISRPEFGDEQTADSQKDSPDVASRSLKGIESS
jgi:hypothetical protein